MSTGRLITEIRAAFRGVQRGHGTSLHEAQAIDDYASPQEREAARGLDAEASWEEVPEEHLQRIAPLLFMDAQGLRYYLPAYMVLVLAQASTGSPAMGALMSVLRVGEATGGKNFGIYSPEQVQAVVHFLEYIAGSEQWIESFEAQEALAKYWAKHRGKNE